MALRLIRSLEFWAALFALAIFTPNFWAVTFEPRLQPVITRLTITDVRAVAVAGQDREDTVIAGHATRLRDCDFQELRWWLGHRNGQRTRVGVTFLDKPEVREAGETSWTGIVVLDIDPEQVVRNSHATAVYRCYSGPWASIETDMPFYDGLGQDVGLLENAEQQQLLDRVEELQGEVDALSR